MTNKLARKLNESDTQYKFVFGNVSGIIEAVRQSTIRSVNSIMTAADWLIGRRIVEFEQVGERRAEYGTTLVEKPAIDLTSRFGGISRQNIQQMRLFYLCYPAEQICQTVSGELAQALRPSRCQTVSGKTKTFAVELDFGQLVESFPLPWSVYVRLLPDRCTCT